MWRTNIVWAFCLAGLLAVTLLRSNAIAAGQGGGKPPAPDPRVAEAQQAALEEKELQAQGKVPDRGYESTSRGTFLFVNGGIDGREDLVGQFQVAGYAYAFQVKVMDRMGADAEVVRKLVSFDGRAVTLGGKIRNKSPTCAQGQYFIVGEVLSQPNGAFVPTQSNTAPGRL